MPGFPGDSKIWECIHPLYKKAKFLRSLAYGLTNLSLRMACYKLYPDFIEVVCFTPWHPLGTNDAQT